MGKTSIQRVGLAWSARCLISCAYIILLGANNFLLSMLCYSTCIFLLSFLVVEPVQQTKSKKAMGAVLIDLICFHLINESQLITFIRLLKSKNKVICASSMFFSFVYFIKLKLS